MTGNGLRLPAFRTHVDYHDTDGPEVGEMCALAGYPPDLEQQLLTKRSGSPRRAQRARVRVVRDRATAEPKDRILEASRDRLAVPVPRTAGAVVRPTSFPPRKKRSAT